MTEVLGSAVETMTLEERCARLAAIAQEVRALLEPVTGAVRFDASLSLVDSGANVHILKANHLYPLGDVALEDPYRHHDGTWSQGASVTISGVRFWSRQDVPAPVREEATA